MLGVQIIVSANGLSLEDGRAFPANVSNGAVLAPSTPQALRNSIETAGDATQYSKVFNIKGTEFGEPLRPMPVTLNITNSGYNCTKPKLYGSKLTCKLYGYLDSCRRLVYSMLYHFLSRDLLKGRFMILYSSRYCGFVYADTTLHTCCVEPSQNITLTGDDIFLPPIPGEITITYDVLQAYTSNYRAMVIGFSFTMVACLKRIC